MKNLNDNEKLGKIKKKLISSGVYIALVAIIVGVTSTGVKNIIDGGKDYENNIPSIDGSIENKNIKLPEIENTNYKPEQSNDTIDFSSKNQGTAVSETPENVNANVTENTATNSEEPEKFTSVCVKPADGYINREFSVDELIYTPTLNDFRTHSGIDITGDIGSKVVSFADGTVSDVYDDPLMGTTVVISHSGGLVSYYQNLSAELPQSVVKGAAVCAGTVIGGIGESAIIESADTPHVHFEIRLDGASVNPEDYLPKE